MKRLTTSIVTDSYRMGRQPVANSRVRQVPAIPSNVVVGSLGKRFQLSGRLLSTGALEMRGRRKVFQVVDNREKAGYQVGCPAIAQGCMKEGVPIFVKRTMQSGI